MKHGKKYLEAAKLIDKTQQYEDADAIALVKKSATAKFDETVEVHIKTGCDSRKFYFLENLPFDQAMQSFYMLLNHMT